MNNQPAQEKKNTGVNRQQNANRTVVADTTGSIDLLELIYRLYDKKWIIIAITLVAAVAMMVYSSFFAKPVYRSQNILYVRNNTSSVVNLSELNTGSSLTKDYLRLFEIHEVRERIVNGVIDSEITERDEVTGEKIVTGYEYAIEGLKAVYPNITASTIRSMLSVSNPSNTRFIYVTAEGGDPEMTRDVANKAAEVVSHFIREDVVDAGANQKDKTSSRMNKVSPSIISEAVKGSKISPNKTRNVFLGVVAGFIISVIIILLQYVMDTKIKTTDDIRRYSGMATLAVVPVLKDNVTTSGRKIKKSGSGRHHKENAGGKK